MCIPISANCQHYSPQVFNATNIDVQSSKNEVRDMLEFPISSSTQRRSVASCWKVTITAMNPETTTFLARQVPHSYIARIQVHSISLSILVLHQIPYIIIDFHLSEPLFCAHSHAIDCRRVAINRNQLLNPLCRTSFPTKKQWEATTEQNTTKPN